MRSESLDLIKKFPETFLQVFFETIPWDFNYTFKILKHNKHRLTKKNISSSQVPRQRIVLEDGVFAEQLIVFRI